MLNIGLGVSQAFSAEGSVAALLSAAFVGWLLIVAAFFFTAHRWAPFVMIAFFLVNLALGTIYIGASLLLAESTVAEKTDAAREFARAFVQCIVWVPYFLVSRRVKATFKK